MGLILVLIEAIAWHGLDNLFIPVVSYVCLTQMIGEPPRELSVRVVVLTIIVAVVFSWRKATRLTQSAIIGTALVWYVTWAVGDWHWFIAPVVTAAAYTFLCHRPARTHQRHTIYAIACIGGLGLCWLALSKAIGTVNTIYAYGVGYGANLAMIALAHFADSGKAARMATAMSRATALSFVPLGGALSDCVARESKCHSPRHGRAGAGGGGARGVCSVATNVAVMPGGCGNAGRARG